MDSMSPGPLFRWTSIAATITSLLRRSAFLYNGCISERVFTEDSEGNKGWNWVCNLLRYLCFVLLDLLSSPTTELLQKIAKETKVGVGFCNLFVIFASFCGFSFLLHYRIFTEDSEVNEGSNWVCNTSLSSLPSV